MSSASKPSRESDTIPIASSTSRINSTWPLNSSGVASRVPLYSGYSSVRNECLDTSKATAIWVGFSVSSKRVNIETKP